MNNKKKWFHISYILFFVALVYTILVKFVDTAAIGPGQSVVGFSTLNQAFHQLFGTNMLFYTITEYLGYVPFLICLVYAIIGFMQLVRYKSLSKVDKKLIYLAIFYVCILLVYVLFEKVVINYRPVLLEGDLEASYPSSHTMLAISICLSSLFISKYFIHPKKLRECFDAFTLLLMIALVVGRTFSGVHWISDIFGGILISLFFVSLYYAFILESDDIDKSIS